MVLPRLHVAAACRTRGPLPDTTVLRGSYGWAQEESDLASVSLDFVRGGVVCIAFLNSFLLQCSIKINEPDQPA